MAFPDFNQLVTLDALLSEGSVVGAAKRMRLSPSAMSRALARLRETMGDPLLVRAGRKLVPTPRATELREPVRQLVQDAAATLRPVEELDLGRLNRTFTLRTSDGFAESFGPSILMAVAAQAPGVRLRFVRKLDKDSTSLRDGSVDLETGVVGTMIGPEVRAQTLFRDHYVGVVRKGHALARNKPTLRGYAEGRHILVARGHADRTFVDDAAEAAGGRRDVVAMVDGYAAALTLVRSTDLIATVPERHTTSLRDGLHSFPLPFDLGRIAISLLWHPRQEADPAHRWLRAIIREACVQGTVA